MDENGELFAGGALKALQLRCLVDKTTLKVKNIKC